MLTWYVLIFEKSMMRSSRSPWCDEEWNAPLKPLSGYVRFEASRPSLNAKTRVKSEANASACRSNISLTCSENESGTPIGAPGSSRGSPLRL